jgi:hypothetical protein
MEYREPISKTSYLIIYGVIMSALATIFFILYVGHDCPTLETQAIEVTKENKETIKKINDAEDKNTIDSLTNILFGFESK